MRGSFNILLHRQEKYIQRKKPQSVRPIISEKLDLFWVFRKVVRSLARKEALLLSLSNHEFMCGIMETFVDADARYFFSGAPFQEGLAFYRLSRKAINEDVSVNQNVTSIRHCVKSSSHSSILILNFLHNFFPFSSSQCGRLRCVQRCKRIPNPLFSSIRCELLSLQQPKLQSGLCRIQECV